MITQIDSRLKKCQSYPVNENLDKAMSNAKNFVDIINEHNPDNLSVTLFVRGSSGIIIGTFMHTIQPDFKVQVVRKSSAHTTSSPWMNNDGLNVIVDDFIETGSTIVSIIEGAISIFDPHLFDLCIVTGSVTDYVIDTLKTTAQIKKLIFGQ